MEKKVKIVCPATPNFLKIASLSLSGDDGVLPIQVFSEEELRELGVEWTEELIKKSKSKLN